MTKWSLFGLVQHLANVAVQWDRKAEKTRADFRSLHLSDTVFFPGMRRLPYPVQLLVLKELQISNNMHSASPRQLSDDNSCDCLFFRQYQLPCSHIWQQQHLFGGILEDEEDWDRYAFMFEDCGFEIYEGMGVEYSTKQLYKEIGAPAKRRLEVSDSILYELLLILLLGSGDLRRPPRPLLLAGGARGFPA